jgi:hypothetical protein
METGVRMSDLEYVLCEIWGSYIGPVLWEVNAMSAGK